MITEGGALGPSLSLLPSRGLSRPLTQEQIEARGLRTPATTKKPTLRLELSTTDNALGVFPPNGGSLAATQGRRAEPL